MSNEVGIYVIIGGASDLATATGKRILDQGGTVILIHHNQQALDRVLPNYDGSAVDIYIADVTNFTALTDIFDSIVKTHGRVDVMINCAGVLQPAPIEQLSLEAWQKVIDVNLTGAFHACKAVAPIMQQQCSGRIINISSLGGRTGRPGVGVNYAASKAGMIGLTQALAVEMAPYGITVNAIAPGPLKGRMFSSLPDSTQKRLQSNIPLGRVGEMDEVAGAILFLAGGDGGWITGEVLDINGGAFI